MAAKDSDVWLINDFAAANIAAMKDYMLLMHNDGSDSAPTDWDSYFARLNRDGRFQGGSSIGSGVCMTKSGNAREITDHLSGYIRVRAESLDDAKELVIGNPAFEAGGTVEIRELPKS